MNNITKNGENLFINFGKLLENRIKIKDDIYSNCIELYNNYLSISNDYSKKIQSMLEKYNNKNKLHQYEDIIFSFGIEIISILKDIFDEYISTLKLSLYFESNDLINDLRKNIDDIIVLENEYNKEIEE